MVSWAIAQVLLIGSMHGRSVTHFRKCLYQQTSFQSVRVSVVLLGVTQLHPLNPMLDGLTTA